MHLVLWAEDSETELRSELARSFTGAPVPSSSLPFLETQFEIEPGRPLPHLAFARQWLPNARRVHAESVRAWADELFSSVAGVLPDGRPWSLQVEPHYGIRAAHHIGARAWHSATRRGAGPDRPKPAGPPSQPVVDAAAGRHRCKLIRDALLELLQRKRRSLLRGLRREPAPFTENESVVQLLLTAPAEGFVSVAAAPLPFEQRHLLSFLPKGEAPAASDKAAPSRAFAKLVEAGLRLGRFIGAGETCVDLGASPGSWTYTAANRGARVIAVDHSGLRDDLMRHPRVAFQAGDAFRFAPARPVDWLLCDVIAPPDRTAGLLLDWLRRRWCARFIVTLKMKDAGGMDALELLKRELPALCREFYLTRLCANKKELCAFGEARAAEA